MTHLSELAMRMSTYDRKNHPLCWYADGIYLCTQNETIAAQIENECKRRNLDYGSVLARDMPMGFPTEPFDHAMVPYDIHKIHINWSLEECDAALQKALASGHEPNMEIWKGHAACCVPALTKKHLADWAITKFNYYAIAEGRKKRFYDVWIQPGKEVPLCIGMTEEEYENGVETHWAAAD